MGGKVEGPLLGFFGRRSDKLQTCGPQEIVASFWKQVRHQETQMEDSLQANGCATVLFPVLGLASAGGAMGFFGGFFVLPAGWWAAGAVTGVVGGALVGVLLSRRGIRHPSGNPESEQRDAVDGGA